jgi:ActR/RegA family two-component response regulator
MARLMLGLLDRGILRLGDNTQVSFEKTIIFMTSNLGAREMMREIAPEIGFQSAVGIDPGEVAGKLQKVAMSAVRRKFSPEFVNRIDHVITYQPLDAASLGAIVDHEVERLQRHVVARLGQQAFAIDVPFAARQWLLENGTSVEYGAREVKRTVHRHLTQPVATMVTRGRLGAGASVRVGVRTDRQALTLRVGKEGEAFGSAYPTVLVVDGNRELLQFLARLMGDAGWDVCAVGTAAEARRVAAKRKPHAALIDSELADERGVNLALQLCGANPELRGIVMAGRVLTAEETAARKAGGVALLEKPFTMRDAMNLIRSRLAEAAFVRDVQPTKAA